MVKAELRGAGDIKALLGRLPAAVGEDAQRQALRLTASDVVETARGLCARGDDPGPQGHLADNIRAFDVPPTDDGKVAVVVSYPRGFFYGHFLEWGFRLVRGGYSKQFKDGRTIGRGKQIGYVPARPFLRPAWDAHKAEFLPTFGEALWHRLSEALPSGWRGRS